MKTALIHTYENPTAKRTGVVNTGTSVQQMVNRLVSNLLNDIIRTNCIVVNEVPGDFFITAGENKIIPVISDLLTTVIANARNGRIYIKAEKFRDILILEIQEHNNYNGYALTYSINAIEPQARMIGGNISIKGQQQLVATISFSFPNQTYNYAYRSGDLYDSQTVY